MGPPVADEAVALGGGGGGEYASRREERLRSHGSSSDSERTAPTDVSGPCRLVAAAAGAGVGCCELGAGRDAGGVVEAVGVVMAWGWRGGRREESGREGDSCQPRVRLDTRAA